MRLWFAAESFPTLIVFDRRMHAVATQGFRAGQTAVEFIAEWMPRIANAESRKLREHLPVVANRASGKPDPAEVVE